MEQTLVLCSLCLGTTCAFDDLWSFLSQTSGQTRMRCIQLDMAAAVVLLYYDYNGTTCMVWVKKKKKNTPPTLTTRCSVSPFVCNSFFLLWLDVEVQRMKKAVESLMVANEEKVPEQINCCVTAGDLFLCLELLLPWTSRCDGRYTCCRIARLMNWNNRCCGTRKFRTWWCRYK